MTTRRAKRAFSLLEVVLAVSLALGLLAAMFGFYQHAVRVRAAVSEEVERVAAFRSVMRLLTEELRSAFVVRFLGQGLEGADMQMMFATVRLPSAVVWVEQSLTETNPLPPERDLQIVGYRLRYVETEDGDIVVAGLDRACQRILTAREAEEGEEIDVEFLTPYVKFLRLRYWDGTAWQEAWQGDDLPQAVEICLGERPLPEDAEPIEYPYPVHRRVVAIPAAGQGQQGTIIRGLGGGSGMGQR
ncbi:MAG: hypothetical protein ISS74_04680 [Planctomycetes bacterium]|nr:hypothetical protein [Planctomycetota bacterium]